MAPLRLLNVEDSSAEPMSRPRREVLATLDSYFCLAEKYATLRLADNWERENLFTALDQARYFAARCKKKEQKHEY